MQNKFDGDKRLQTRSMSNVSNILRNQMAEIRNSDLRSTMVSQVSYYPTEGNRPEDQIYKG